MIHYFQQGSEEWLVYKKERFSASNAQAIYSHDKGLRTLIQNMFEEKPFYDNEAMIRGRELEPIALSLFEIEEGIYLDFVGFVDYTPNSGCSPDGLIMEEGKIISGVEVKCRDLLKHNNYIMGRMDKKTLYQIQFCMMVCNVDYWYFVAYNPDHLIPLYIQRIEADYDIINELRYGLEIAELLLLNYKKERNG